MTDTQWGWFTTCVTIQLLIIVVVLCAILWELKK